MIGTSGEICPVTGLQRAERCLVLMSSMICWMEFLSRRRVSNFFLLNDDYFLRLQFGQPRRSDLGQGRQD